MPAVLDSIGVPADELLRLVEMVGRESNSGYSSERHPVWSTPEVMKHQFEKRLNKLMDMADQDEDGFVNKNHFTKVIIDHFRYKQQMLEDDL